MEPAGATSTIARILGANGEQPDAQEGESITLVLTDEIDASRGSVIVAGNAKLPVADRLRARLFWASDAPLAPGDQFWLKIGTATVGAVVDMIKGRVDLQTGAGVAAGELGPNDIGDVVLSLDRDVAFESYERNRQLGGFILISRDTMDTAALGLATS